MINELLIKNFKGFQELNISNIKRINLIGGKNNVGKTSLLECLFNILSSKSSDVFFKTKIFRGVSINFNLSNGSEFEVWNSFFYNNNIDNQILIKTKSTENETIEYCFEIKKFDNTSQSDNLNIKIKKNNSIVFENNLFISLPLNPISQINPIAQNNLQIIPIQSKIIKNDVDKFNPNLGHYSSPFISQINDVTINMEYSKIIENNKENEILQYLQLIEPKLENIVPTVNNNNLNIMCKIEGLDKRISIKELGDGLKQFFSLIVSLYSSSVKILLVDEIGTGIHFSFYEKMWEVLLKISSEKNKQIFATTHHYEIIKEFNKVSLKDSNDKYFSYIELFENKNQGKIEANVFNSERLQYKLENDYAFRGE